MSIYWNEIPGIFASLQSLQEHNFAKSLFGNLPTQCITQSINPSKGNHRHHQRVLVGSVMLTKQTKLVLLIFIFMLLIMYWLSYTSSLTHTFQPVSKTQALARQKTRVVVLAYGRTGSSFLGGIFNAHPDVFYLYEPLLTLLKFTDQSSDSYLNNVEEVLHSIFNCNFTDGLYLQYLSKFRRYRAVSRPLVSPPFCNVSYQFAIDFAENRTWQMCVRNIDAHALNKMCRNKGHIVVKILAPRLKNVDFSWLLRVSGTGLFPVRILYIVRDPRAMHFSRYRLGWIAPQALSRDSLENGIADCKVRKVCDTIEQHLREITKYTDVIQLVRYEDLATSPEAYVGQLFSSLRLSPSNDVIRWLKEKNHASERPNHFSLSRELKTVLISWRKNIPPKLLKTVETRCGRIMKYLGYLPTNGSLTLLHNLQNPLFFKQWEVDPSVGFSRRHTAANRGGVKQC